MVGKTERTLYRNVIEPMVAMLGKARCRYVAGRGELVVCDRVIYVVGANDERAQDRIRGMTLAGALVDEASLVPESFWRMLGTRLSVPGAQLFATTNPDNPGHWLMRDYLSRASRHITGAGALEVKAGGLDLARYTFRLADNPHLPAEYVTALTAEYSGLWRRRFILGEWVIAAGAIYEAWDPDRHVVAPTDIPRIDRWLAVGIDHGTRNPLSAVLLGLATSHDGVRRLYLVDEWRWSSIDQRRQMTNAEYSAAVRAWLGGIRRPGEGATSIGVEPEWVYVDPSAADFRLQLYTDGVPGVAAADNAVTEGIQSVASVLTADRLRVSSTCTGWISEVGGYSWDDGQAAKGTDAPIKVDDHSMDAGRYAIASTRWAWSPELELHSTTPDTAATAA
jgi:PBSX family phage terminase large subunit